MSHREGNEGDQYKSYKEVIKEGNDRSYAYLTRVMEAIVVVARLSEPVKGLEI